jgi:hypothetical protein
MLKTKDAKIQLEELSALALPIREWLMKNYHPHAYVAINIDSVDLGEAILSAPFKDWD